MRKAYKSLKVCFWRSVKVSGLYEIAWATVQFHVKFHRFAVSWNDVVKTVYEGAARVSLFLNLFLPAWDNSVNPARDQAEETHTHTHTQYSTHQEDLLLFLCY